MIEEEKINTFFKVQQKTDKEHILDNPDTYIGSVEHVDSNMWVMENNENMIVEKNINYVPGLYKLFDEGIVNCRDHAIRMKLKVENNVSDALPVTHIDINLNEDNSITMMNDGNGIDVVKQDGIWIPELVFAHLRTSTNYDKLEKKIVGGKNGFGFKLVLIWSTYGMIETIDHIRGLKYVQEFKNNLNDILPPKITKVVNKKPYTRITFKPDYERLHLKGLNADMISLMKKRVYDIAGVTNDEIKVRYNNTLVPIKSFEQYVNLYIGDKSQSKRVHEKCGERWEYVVALTPKSEFVQISFVNGINTTKGGRHVEYILNQITRKMAEYIKQKRKIDVNQNTIKEQLILFVKCDIENPSFDSQTKDYLNTPISKFGSKCEVSDNVIDKLVKMGLLDASCALCEIKEKKALKKLDGVKTKNIRGIPKLTDAILAGTEKSKDCSLVLCEGDSAKSGVISGLSSEDRNTIGVYPLKGKPLNLRDQLLSKIAGNKEINELIQILGLVRGHKYENIQDVNKNLRYSKIILMTDQDLDGSHIKGLCINLFSCEWSSLLKIPGFICFMNTPILKATFNTKSLSFYNNGEYENWKKETANSDRWKIKYYKGLGTSTGKEFKEYFEHKKIVNFTFDDKTDELLDLVFNKKKSNERKEWLKTYDKDSFLNTDDNSISYTDFINKEFIHFSIYDCQRSLPNIMDGLKTSQRKILYSAFKRNLVSEIKVAQFAGYVSEHSGYHHGEASLNAAIVGMAQNYVGSNNINLLIPSGQFGTRLQGGKDSASERYIFTYLNPISRFIYKQIDDDILSYKNDDGQLVEPSYYMPIIPMILVNGSNGIGTGYSTDIPCYNAFTIIEYLKCKLNNEPTSHIEFIPYYNGFLGSINKISPNKFLIKGKYEVINSEQIKVTELPIGYWTENFIELLDELSVKKESEKTKDKEKDKEKEKEKEMNLPLIKEIKNYSTEEKIHFNITFSKGKLEELLTHQSENGCNQLEKTLKLYTTISTSNIHMFDSNEKLQLYENIENVIDEYFDVRLNAYLIRKNKTIAILENEIILLKNKVNFINSILNDEIDLRQKKSDVIIKELINKSFIDVEKDGFKYLIKMPLDSVSKENIEKLTNEYLNKLNEIEKLKNTSIEEIWLNELEELKREYIEFISNNENEEKPKKNLIKVLLKNKKRIIKN